MRTRVATAFAVLPETAGAKAPEGASYDRPRHVGCGGGRGPGVSAGAENSTGPVRCVPRRRYKAAASGAARGRSVPPVVAGGDIQGKIGQGKMGVDPMQAGIGSRPGVGDV
ncbi:hypothetical protein C8N32_10479 [Rhodovulum imhoffii]|uniref:Uncharacterized protein n=1 Tax=Rhodovulum imhoffii TaxID=365340 RepID=A0A2T5BU18_9RHOB|nr:hypothetical protein [Rhodovulum imhoffii]MBK5932761.1 hypothetical protein [Rhodovulum imhoffii]PTN02968.1 hypothetical protein C8N32_10479 [Rhodovulum imhoffii]